MARPKWLTQANFKRLGRIAARVIAVLGAALVVQLIGLTAFIFLGNGEFHERGAQSVVAGGHVGNEATIVTLLMHKVLAEENAVEASVIVYVQGVDNIHMPPDDDPCFTLTIDDRGTDRAILPSAQSFDCVAQPGANFIARQSPRFLLPIYQSVQPFPLDDIETLPLVMVDGRGHLPPARYVITKLFPGRVLSITGNSYNWEVHLRRSSNEIILVIVSATLFVALSLFIAWRIAFSESRLTGMQDLLAVASYIIAAVGFRDLLGVNRIPGTSVFEIGVLIVPLLVLSGAIVVGHIRNS